MNSTSKNRGNRILFAALVSTAIITFILCLYFTEFHSFVEIRNNISEFWHIIFTYILFFISILGVFYYLVVKSDILLPSIAPTSLETQNQITIETFKDERINFVFNEINNDFQKIDKIIKDEIYIYLRRSKRNLWIGSILSIFTFMYLLFVLSGGGFSSYQGYVNSFSDYVVYRIVISVPAFFMELLAVYFFRLYYSSIKTSTYYVNERITCHFKIQAFKYAFILSPEGNHSEMLLKLMEIERNFLSNGTSLNSIVKMQKLNDSFLDKLANILNNTGSKK